MSKEHKVSIGYAEVLYKKGSNYFSQMAPQTHH